MASLQFLIRYVRQYPTLVTAVIGFSLIGAGLNGASTALVIPVLLQFLNSKAAASNMPQVIQKMLSWLHVAPDAGLPILMAIVIGLLLLKNIASYLGLLVTAQLKRHVVSSLRNQGVKLLLEVDIDFFAKNKLGDINNRLSHEVTRTSDAIKLLAQMLSAIATITVFVGLLLLLSWRLTLMAILLIPLLALANQFVIKRSKVAGRALALASREYAVNMLELLFGMRLVRSAGMEASEYLRLQDLEEQREEAEFQSQSYSALIQPVSEMTGIIAIFLIMAVGQSVIHAPGAASGILLTYLFLLFRLLPVLIQLNFLRGQLANLTASVEIVQDLLNPKPKPLMGNGSIPFVRLNQSIQFNQVNFSYPGHSQQVLDQVSLSLPKNTTLALVGASGSGKSTLADLLPRFYDTVGGSITIDGQDLRQFDFRTLRRAMGIVSQDTFLFNASVRRNIAYGAPEATDAEIIHAAQQANAYEFIIQLPEGFETLIGDRGVMLSGGQRQRIAIARAILKNPEILILDEATSALDSVSERLVQEALDHLSQDRTTLVIAHRLSTIQRADQIAVMDRGRVAEIGTHRELLAKQGYYARLCKMQFAELTQAS